MPLSCRNPTEPDHLTARERRLALTRPTTSIAHRLVEAREAAGLSQAEAARLAAVSLKTLKAWENGKTTPRPNKLQMLSGVLSVPLLWLLGGGEQYEPVDTRTSRLDMLEQKVSRLADLQREINTISGEIAADLTAIRQLDAELDKLAS
jgi:transcriptional regulator with XRE-family HTH domain